MSVPDCVSELAWYVVSASRPHEMLRSAKALRRGDDRWIVWDGSGLFLHSPGYDLWRWIPARRHYEDEGWVGAEPQRFTFDGVCDLVPKVILDEVRFPGGQFAHIADLTVVAGWLPDRVPTEGATTR